MKAKLFLSQTSQNTTCIEGLKVDCSQSPIVPCDRRDRARLTVNGGHLDFQSYRV